MQSKYRLPVLSLSLLIMTLIILPGAYASRVYYQEFSILVDKEVLITFEPQFTNYTVIVTTSPGNLKYTYVHAPNQLKFIAHSNGTYIIRIAGTDVYNESLVLVYVIEAYGKIVPPPPPSFTYSSEFTTILNKTVVFNYPELSKLNVTVTPEQGAEIKSKTETQTEVLFTEVGRYEVLISGTTREGSNYSLNIVVDVVSIVSVNVEQKEVKVVTYSIPQWQAFLYLVLFFIPLFGVLAFFYRRSVSLENVLRGVLSHESNGRNPGENQTEMGEGNS